MAVKDLIAKVKEVPGYVKSHWNTPGEGEHLTLKEMAAFTAAQAGTYIFATVSGIMTFSATYFCGAIMEIAALDFSVITIVTNIINYILMFTNPIGVLIYENHGRLSKKMKIFAHSVFIAQTVLGLCCYLIPSQPFEFIMKGLPQIIGNILVINGVTGYFNWFIRKKFSAKYGRLKPFLLICGLPSAIIMSIIPFLPLENASYTNKLVILHFAFTLMNYFYNNFIGTNTLVTFMTPNSQERQKLYSIVPIITGFFPSIINMFFPILIGITGGYLNIKTYKVFVPIFAFIGAAVSMSIAFCKERVIEPPIEKRATVTFWKGAKNVIKNKYLWIINIANTVGQWQGLIGNLLAWWFIYSLRMEWFSGVAANIVVVGMTAGNLLCPILTKRYQKRTILLSSRSLILLTVFGMVLAVKLENIYIFLACMFLRNTITPVVDGVNSGLNADIMVYHQWRFGERADAMSQVFGWFINPIMMLTALIIPWLQKTVGFTSDWDVLFDSTVLNNVFNIYIWASIISIILMTVPYLFYDLTKEKYEVYVKELEERVRQIEQEDEPVEVAQGGVQV